MLKKSLAGLTIALLLVIGVPESSNAAAPLRVVALSGDAVPGADEGLSLVRAGSMNALGQVAFAARAGSTAGVLVDGIWSETATGLQPIALSGTQAAGMSAGSTYAEIEFVTPSVTLTDSGDVLFGTRFEPAPGQPNAQRNDGLWRHTTTGTELLIRAGAHAPGLPLGVSPRFLPDVVLSRSGAALIQAPRSDSASIPFEDADAVWTMAPGEPLALRATTGGPAFPGSAGDTMAFAGAVAINGNGDAAWTVSPGRNSSLIDFNSELWSIHDGQPVVVVRHGDVLPLVGTVDSIDAVGVFQHGGGIFAADHGSNDAIWLWDHDQRLTPLVLPGQLAPGLTAGERLDASVLLLNNRFTTRGNTALLPIPLVHEGDVTVLNDAVLLRGGVEQELKLIVRAGDPAPGLDGPEFRGPFRESHLNDRGQVALGSRLQGEGINTRNDYAIFVEDLNGEMLLVAREGETLNVGAEGLVDERTVSNLALVETDAINNRGQVAFVANFTDGSSGLIVSDLVATAPGDHNGDGQIDAADYTLWRDWRASAVEYQVWRDAYGSTANPTANPAARVPEPPTLAAAIFLLTAARLRRHPAAA